jgi:hypothetical protein
MTATYNTEWIEEWAKRCLRYFRDPNRKVTCRACRGTGRDSTETRCATCRGKGSYTKKKGHALYDRAIVERLRDCREFGVAPPPPLIELVEFRLLGDRKRKSKQQDSERWIAAAKYRAVHPECSIRELVAAVMRAVPQERFALGTAQSWLKDPGFQADVNFWASAYGEWEHCDCECPKCEHGNCTDCSNPECDDPKCEGHQTRSKQSSTR